MLERAAGFHLGGDAGRAEGVVADPGPNSANHHGDEGTVCAAEHCRQGLFLMVLLLQLLDEGSGRALDRVTGNLISSGILDGNSQDPRRRAKMGKEHFDFRTASSKGTDRVRFGPRDALEPI
jgi:hypothetical protein